MVLGEQPHASRVVFTSYLTPPFETVKGLYQYQEVSVRHSHCINRCDYSLRLCPG